MWRLNAGTLFRDIPRRLLRFDLMEPRKDSQRFVKVHRRECEASFSDELGCV